MRRSALVVSLAIALAAGISSATLLAQDAATPAAAATAKEEKVRKLLRLQGQEEVAKQTLDTMLDQFAGTPGLPAGFIEKFKEKATAKEILDLSVPTFVKHLDEATIDAAIAFYETPEGKKLAAKSPVMTTEAMEAGAAWGQKKAMEVLAELQQPK